QAGIEPLAALGEPAQHLDRAVDRRPFLVAGYEQAERILATARDIIGGGGDEAGDGALHVGGAAPIELVTEELAAEGIDAPALGPPDRHHVGMAGEAEIAAAGADAGVEIVDRRRAG